MKFSKNLATNSVARFHSNFESTMEEEGYNSEFGVFDLLRVEMNVLKSDRSLDSQVGAAKVGQE